MKRRILIEMDMEEGGSVVNDIIQMVVSRIDSDVEFDIRQEIVPGKSSGGIQVPNFLNGKREPAKQKRG